MYIRELIEYYGINKCVYGELHYFKQVNEDFTFCLPNYKSCIEQIVRVWVTPHIIQQSIVVTPKGTSLEGQTITGHKVMLIGDLVYKVEYVALDEGQGLHTAQINRPFGGYIVLPETFNTNTSVTTSIAIEDIYSKLLDTRCIYTNVTMMLIADVC